MLWLALLPVWLQAQTQVWTLEACIEQAWTYNLTIQQKELTRQSGEADLKQAKEAPYPNLSASGSESYSVGRSIDPFSYQYTTQPVWSTNLSLNSSLTLFQGFRLSQQIRQQYYSTAAASQDVAYEKNVVALDIAAAYLQVLLTREKTAVARRQVQVTDSQLVYTERQYAAGIKAQSEVLQIKTQLAQNKATLTQAENDFTVARLTLAQLMEIPFASDFTVAPLTTAKEEWLLNREPETPEYVYQAALNTMPEVESGKLSRASAAAGLKYTQGSYWPTLSLSGSLSTGYSSTQRLTQFNDSTVEGPIGYLQNDPSLVVIGQLSQTETTQFGYSFRNQLRDNLSKSLNLSLSIPIYSRRQARTSVEKARIDVQRTETELKDTQNQLRKRVEDAYTDYTTARSQYASAQEQVSSALASYHSVRQRYAVGATGAYNLLAETNTLQSAESQYVQGKYQLIFSKLILDFYSGNPIAW